MEADRDNSAPGCFIYKVSVENGGKDHPFREIFRFARKRRDDLDVIIVVSPVKCGRNHEDVLCLAGKPGRVSYSCHLEVSELSTPYGREPMMVTVPVRAGYPTTSTLDSLFSEGPASFTKLAAEPWRCRDKKPHSFDFGVTMDEPDLGMTKISRRRLAAFMESDPETVQRLMEREFARSREKSRLKEKRRKPAKIRKLAEKLAETKSMKTSGGKETERTESKTKSTAKNQPAKSIAKDQPAKTGGLTESQLTGMVDTEPTTTGTNSSADVKTKSRKTARDKFRRCENCDMEISDRIQLCSGCKKVAYCNNNCQKSHWKQHKKTCTYIQKASEHEKTRACGSCEKELSERVMLCAGCKKTAYCDATCQKVHWREHKKTCSYKKKDAGTMA
jgi:hypothetical protein